MRSKPLGFLEPRPLLHLGAHAGEGGCAFCDQPRFEACMFKRLLVGAVGGSLRGDLRSVLSPPIGLFTRMCALFLGSSSRCFVTGDPLVLEAEQLAQVELDR